MNDFFAHFHFLRPYLLLGLCALVPLYFLLKKAWHSSQVWQNLVDAPLLKHLLQGDGQPRHSALKLWLALLAWALACLALAGPAWQKTEQPVIQNQHALMIVLDLSLSMYAQDEQPSRLVRAKRKITDLLAQRKEGLSALIVYSGDAHLVIPFTQDNQTIDNLLPALAPNMMPSFGSNIVAALTLAQAQIDKLGQQQAQILLLTDEIDPAAFDQAMGALKQPKALSIITFGSPTGAPIPIPNQGFLKDNQGSTAFAQLNDKQIQQMAASYGITVTHNQIDNSDLTALTRFQSDNQPDKQAKRLADIWQDNGIWLALLILPMALLGFRRGVLLSLCFLLMPQPSYASSFQQLWQNSNQQAKQQLDAQHYSQAAKQFTDPDWQAYSYYRAGDYQKAAQLFTGKNSTSLYNKANALTHLGQYDQAVAAYNQALAQQPDFEAAEHNKAIAQKLEQLQKQQQKQQSSDKNQDKSAQQQQQQNQDKQQQSPKDQQQEKNQQQQNADQQKTGKQKSDEKKASSADQQQAKKDKEQEQKEQEQKKAQQQQAEKKNAQPSPADAKKKADASQQAALSPEEKQQQQALHNWLKTVDDDPGGLLRNKFYYQYQQNLRHNKQVQQGSKHPW